jgi:recombination DNA repair RAD52 pathway protein
MNSNIMQQLSEPFPREVERQLKKGGTSLTYIPVSEVINRLNKVLGFDAWSYEIIKCERDALDPDFIVAHVRMTVYPGSDKFVSVTKDGFGGQKIKRTKQGDIVDLGDEFKGAVSDALKKAAQALGVGLYLARSEEAIDIEEAMSITPQEQERLDKWEQFAGLAKSLNTEQKTELNDFWEDHAGGRPKPTKSNATIQDLDDLISEIVRIQLGGTLVE